MRLVLNSALAVFVGLTGAIPAGAGSPLATNVPAAPTDSGPKPIQPRVLQQALEQLHSGSSESIRIAAAQTIGRLPVPCAAVASELQQAASTDPSPRVRVAAAVALHRLSGQGSWVPATAKPSPGAAPAVSVYQQALLRAVANTPPEARRPGPLLETEFFPEAPQRAAAAGTAGPVAPVASQIAARQPTPRQPSAAGAAIQPVNLVSGTSPGAKSAVVAAAQPPASVNAKEPKFETSQSILDRVDQQLSRPAPAQKSASAPAAVDSVPAKVVTSSPKSFLRLEEIPTTLSARREMAKHLLSQAREQLAQNHFSEAERFAFQAMELAVPYGPRDDSPPAVLDDVLKASHRVNGALLPPALNGR